MGDQPVGVLEEGLHGLGGYRLPPHVQERLKRHLDDGRLRPSGFLRFLFQLPIQFWVEFEIPMHFPCFCFHHLRCLYMYLRQEQEST